MKHLFKLSNSGTIVFSIFLTTLLTITSYHGFGQALLISNWKQYKNHIKEFPAHELTMIPINTLSGIQYNPVYSTKNNFTGVVLYSTKAHPYLNKDAADALLKLNTLLSKEDLGILIWDAYRPHAVTQKMWDVVGDERYVANPKTGSGHNKGLAIDLTLYQVSTGKLLEMGTDFDNLTDSADHSFIGVSNIAKANRKLLRAKMESVGFKAYEAEWWHYSWPGTKDWPLFNLNFKKLYKKLQ